MRDSPSMSTKFYDYARDSFSHIHHLVHPVVQGRLLDSVDRIPDCLIHRCMDNPHSHCCLPLHVPSAAKTDGMGLETRNGVLPFAPSAKNDTLAATKGK